MKRILQVALAVLILAIAGSVYAGTTTEGAYKSGFNLFGSSIRLDHTYFCLNGTSDCYSITGWGITSSKSGGSYVSGTSGRVSTHDRCLARFRASNNPINPCYIFYGITGVCHQHANGGLSVRGNSMNPSLLLGGWAARLAYGTYGNARWIQCTVASQAACVWTW